MSVPSQRAGVAENGSEKEATWFGEDFRPALVQER
jgi:hypothetical protein